MNFKEIEREIERKKVNITDLQLEIVELEKQLEG